MGRREKSQWRQQRTGRQVRGGGGGDDDDGNGDLLPSAAYEPETREEDEEEEEREVEEEEEAGEERGEESPRGDISYLQKFFLTYVGGRMPLHLQEDFCGTALLRQGRWRTSLREAGALIREPSPAGQGESCLDSRLPKAGMGQLGVVIYGARLYLG
ncbi:hypothetical protein Taro_052257 [Colocasia esculenta]|uniref:Uncharacterized protein n=1 Tax=Colocasia esculenta TaxID=4460 RepID=A0A843XIU1_COLES|nr:hypothetical protein [Colocasia esculenta]